MRPTLLLLITFLATSSHLAAAVMHTSGDVVVSPLPAPANESIIESDTQIFVFNEQQNVWLESGQLGIPAGSVVSFHRFHFDPVDEDGGVHDAVGSATFDSDVLAMRTVRLESSDSYELQADNCSVSVSFLANTGHDQLRVITGPSYIPPSDQAIFLDFSSYSPPSEMGDAEDIAADVEAIVRGRFSRPNTVFLNSFFDTSPPSDRTSTVVFDGSHANPGRLGEAGIDYGNKHLTDCAVVYADQPYFVEEQHTPEQYRQALGNVASHEIGHLLGYTHAEAIGMPWMDNGGHLKTRLEEELPTNILGQAIMDSQTHLVQTTMPPEAYPTAVEVRSITFTPSDQAELMQAYTELYERSGEQLTDFAVHAVQTLYEVGDLTCLVASWAGKTIPGYMPLLVVTPHMADVFEIEGPAGEALRGTFLWQTNPKETVAWLDLESASKNVIAAEWSEEVGGFVLEMTEEEYALLEDQRVTVAWLTNGSHVGGLTIADENGTAIASMDWVTVPEPSTLTLLALGAGVLARRSVKRKSDQ